jgi:septal ring factor EnvC (AmiA/AmiB activator)
VKEEQREKWYKSFTREQLIERCEYLQRSCERKEETITDREMENTDLETKIEKLKEENYELYLQCRQYEDKEEDLENKIERLNNIIKEAREYVERETKELYSRNKSCKYLGEIMQLENVLEILDKVGSDKE